MTKNLPTCQRCHVRPATGNTLSVLGPLDTREEWHCRSCYEALVAEYAGEPPPAEDDLSWLGPIDFAVLRASIVRSEADPAVLRDEFAAVAPELRRIAAAHGQALPEDILSFIERHTEGHTGT